jgi:Tetratricopeptide repeat
MRNLARVLSSQSKDEDAEEVERHTLRLCKRVLGKEHPSTRTSIYYLAYLF